ncbi:hypothetical protein [Streptomyces sp. NPDC056480]|uniref:hypothetical protein n=1 Tax=Streptomyces sp. NPDC056480 TaxID=3345833 RepID=UPI0036791464
MTTLKILIEVPAPPYQGDLDRSGRAPIKIRNGRADEAVRGIRLLAERVDIDLTCHGKHSKYGAGHGHDFDPLPVSRFVHITAPWTDADQDEWGGGASAPSARSYADASTLGIS